MDIEPFKEIIKSPTPPGSDGTWEFDTDSLLTDWALFLVSLDDRTKRLCITEKRHLPVNARYEGHGFWDLQPHITQLICDGGADGAALRPQFDGPHIDLSQASATSLRIAPPVERWLPVVKALTALLSHLDSVLWFFWKTEHVMDVVLNLHNSGVLRMKDIDWKDEFGILIKTPGITVEDSWRAVAATSAFDLSDQIRCGFRNLIAAIDRGRQDAVEDACELASTKPFVLSLDAKWRDLTLRIVNETLIHVNLGGAQRRIDMGTLSLVDRRTGRLNDQGRLLVLFAKLNGVLMPTAPERNRVKQKVYRLRSTLQDYFKIPGDPLPRLDRKHRSNEGWMTAFQIEIKHEDRFVT
ncbi:MAG: hypothetical protein IT366_17830 [Candidatus Hydrogenedentes bacterium]|nr:hypothetical protein [Candidatus Hydrogenedentota bacterium]